MRERLHEWQRAYHMSQDESVMFVPEDEGWARNSGLWIKVRTDNSKSRDEEKSEHAANCDTKQEEASRWLQQQQECRLIKLWLANAKERAGGRDQIDCVLHSSRWIPNVEWMALVMPGLQEQNKNVQWLHEMVGNYVTASQMQRKFERNTRLQEILQFVGKERNPLHKNLAGIEETCCLRFLFRTRMQKLYTSIKNALVQMHTCELAQWRLDAMSIDDLKKQNLHLDRWLADYVHV